MSGVIPDMPLIGLCGVDGEDGISIPLIAPGVRAAAGGAVADGISIPLIGGRAGEGAGGEGAAGGIGMAAMAGRGWADVGEATAWEVVAIPLPGALADGCRRAAARRFGILFAGCLRFAADLCPAARVAAAP
jgi:hypothetical protein